MPPMMAPNASTRRTAKNEWNKEPPGDIVRQQYRESIPTDSEKDVVPKRHNVCESEGEIESEGTDDQNQHTGEDVR